MGRLKIKENEKWRKIAWLDEVDDVESELNVTKENLVEVGQDLSSYKEKQLVDATEIKGDIKKNADDIVKVETDLSSHKEDYMQNVVKLKNGIIDGKFENIDNIRVWRGSSINISNNELEVSLNGESQIRIVLNTNVKVAINDIIYTSVESQSDNKTFTYAHRETLAPTSSILGLVIDSVTTVHSEWSRHSVCRKYTVTGDVFFSTYSAVSSYIKMRNPLIMNLTKVFGKGNEPTKEEMDLLVDQIGWFDGELTLTQKQIMNWQLALIRQNRNAIIELGGTI